MSVIARRWYVVVVVLFLTVAAALVVHNRTTTSYQATASVAFTSNPLTFQQLNNPDYVRPSNQLLTIGGIATFANLVAMNTTQPAVARLLDADASGQDNTDSDNTDEETTAQVTSGVAYSVSVPVPQAGQALVPILAVTTQAVTAEAARNSMTSLLGLIERQTIRVQTNAHVPGLARLHTFVVAAPGTTTPVVSSTTRATVAVVLVGVLAALILAALLDGAIAAVRRRRA